MSLDITEVEKQLGAVPEQTASTYPKPPEAKLLSQLVRIGDDDPSELLKHRFLCRGTGLVILGPTGIGKSSFSMQVMILLAIGRAAFGIAAPKPLKSVLIQAENDDGDLAEMRDGIIVGLSLTPDEAQRAMENIIVVREDERTGMTFLQEVVRPLLEKYGPDLLWIDPALAYLGGEASSQSDVGRFLRKMNPLAREFNCAFVVVHHTNKPPVGREKPEWGNSECAYLSSGSIEWANWPRAILAIRSCGLDSVFELRAAKREKRLDWTGPDGITKSNVTYIAHTRDHLAIYWRAAEASELPEVSKKKKIPTKEDILSLVPANGPIGKDELRIKAQVAGVGQNRFNRFVAELVADGVLQEAKEKRSGTNPRKLLTLMPTSANESTP